MIGKTNSKQKSDSSSEFVNIQLITNQLEHNDLVGIVFNVSYETYNLNFTWNGSEITLSVPAYVSCTIKFPEVEGYKKPDNITFVTVEGNSRTIEAEYKTELLTINVSADSGTPTGFEVTISKKMEIDISLPDGYTAVWYIQSNGTQYIDTGFKPNQDTRIVADMHLLQNNSSVAANELFGARTSTSSKAFAVQYNNTKGKLQYFYGGGYTELSASLPNAKAVCDANKNNLSYNGTEISRSYSAFQCDYSLYLFALNNAGSVSFQSISRMYSCKIYDNGTLVRDYIPVLRSDGIAGLYDLVNNTFLSSNEGSNFVTGGDAKEIIAVQTSVTGSYKIPFETSYTISTTSVNGYITPSAITRTASAESYTAAVLYKIDPVKDLSKFDIYGNAISQTTANCYVVNATGTYKIPLVFGNALKNGAANSAAYTKKSGSYSHDFVDYNGMVVTSPYIESVSGTAASAQLSIADTDGVFSDFSIIDGSPCRYLQFKVNSVPATGANGVLSIKNSSGVIMWSWHIWVWADSLATVEITNSTGVKYNILPVNLASKWDSSSKTTIKNWFYQFGRPNPMLCSSAYNSTSNHASYGSLGFSITSVASHLYKGIQNPTTFFKYGGICYNWFDTNSDKTYNLWDQACTSIGCSDNNVVKTVYDPCPPGFKMPNGNTFTGFIIINTSNGIVKFTRYSGDSIGVGFPILGYRELAYGSLDSVSSTSDVWLSSAFSWEYAYCLGFSSSKVGYSSNYRSYGFSVRPVQE